MQRILLASHGTNGARAAELVAVNRLQPGDQLFHLQVVPDFWDGMQGDDWLNNSSTRDVFAVYVENSLETEAKVTFDRVAAMVAKRGARCETRLVYDKPAQALLKAVADVVPDLVIIGAPRPKYAEGQNSKMLTESMLRSMVVPLLVIPYPDV